MNCRKFFNVWLLVVFLGFVGASGALAQPLPGGTLDPTTIPKYVDSLIIPPPMPKVSSDGLDYYEITVRQFEQQILPSTGSKNKKAFPKTTVWSYVKDDDPSTFNYPAFTIEAQVGKPTQVKWINGLVDKNGNYLKHLLPVDQTLHWANPPAGPGNQDSPGKNAALYEGPVPIITHLHGGLSKQEFDGFPEAWYLPDARNIPAGFAKTGSNFEYFKNLPTNALGSQWGPGVAVFEYANQQAATTLWYHDHSLGMTRLNVYAGPAGFYLLRGGAFDASLAYNPPGSGAAVITEIPIVIQDRSFNTNGSLFYPAHRKFFDGFTGPFLPSPKSDVPPRWNPEAFFNTMVVNGRTWPVLNVEPRRYRIRFLNGCNSRFLVLKLVTDPLATRPATEALSFLQIGADGGFLPAPETQTKLLMGLAERADVIIDFTSKENTTFYLINEGPDEPFGGGVANTDFLPADPGTTGQVMKIVVGTTVTGTETGIIPIAEDLPDPPALGATTNTRQVSLNEMSSALPFGGPIKALLGTVDTGPFGVPLMWVDPITENPAAGSVEEWEIYNFTEDAHPIHIHEVQFEIVGREPIAGGTSVAGQNTPLHGETGRKDTVIAYPDEITRVKALYEQAGLFVWHCHILEHEDNEMMRPYCIGPLEDCQP